MNGRRRRRRRRQLRPTSLVRFSLRASRFRELDLVKVSEASMGTMDSPEVNEVGADMFNYYSRVVAELLAKDDGGGDEKDSTCTRTGSMLFGDAIGARLSDSKRERLKSLLRQGVFVLTPQVDEMLESVLKMHDLQLLLQSNKQQEAYSDATSDCEIVECPPKKLRMSSPASPTSVSAHESPVRDEFHGEVDDFLLMLMKKDSSKVEAILKKYSDELSAKLENTRRRLEEVLDTVISKCRLMTSLEKEQLRRQVMKLPKEYLGRASEIIGYRKGSVTESDQGNFSGLEKADNITLWRLYYYVEAVQKASVTTL